MRLSELTPADLRELRVLAAIELAYPEQTKALGDKRASVILGKWEALDASREKPTTGGVRQCATCGAKSTMANSVRLDLRSGHTPALVPVLRTAS